MLRMTDGPLNAYLSDNDSEFHADHPPLDTGSGGSILRYRVRPGAGLRLGSAHTLDFS